MKRFPDKRVFITGAGSGLGRALAMEFAKTGWRIAVADIHDVRAEETGSLVKSAGGSPLILHCDVSIENDLKDAAQRVVSEWNGVDVVINNAGVAGSGYMEEIPMDKWDWILNINLKGAIHGCRAFIPLLKKQGNGYIVNTASYLGFISSPESSCYNLTKAGIISLSETLRLELSKHGIGVSVVMPSFFVTNLMDQFYASDERQKELVTGLFEKSKFPAEKVAKSVIRGIRRDRLHIIPQWDAKILWTIKRLFPRTYFRIFEFVYRRDLVEKYFGIDA